MRERVSETQDEQQVVLGSITSVYGVKGWVKVFSHTDPMTNILNYKHWILDNNGRQYTVEIDQGRRQGKGLLARIAGCHDRNIARQYCGAEIRVTKSELPQPTDDEVYWYDLEGLSVIASDEKGQDVLLGTVSHLMATGANDVLVVRPCSGSLDKRARLIPWLINQVVLSLQLDEEVIRVDWDPEF